jgi:hypothetical protein
MWRQSLEATKRVLRLSWGRLFRPSDVLLFTSSVIVVYSAGLIEASYLLAEPWTNHLPLTARYALAQVVPSTTWDTIAIELVVQSAGYDGSLCREFFDTPADARDQIIVAYLATLRQIVASFMALSQLLRSFSLGLESGEVINGRINVRWLPFSCSIVTLLPYCFFLRVSFL